MACNTYSHLKLPEEIWMEIFLRCSVESLLRASCVCKPWHALIISPNFISDHLQYQKLHNKGRLLLQHSTEEAQLFRYLLFDDETLTRETYHELDHFTSSQRRPLIYMEGPVNGLYCLFNSQDRIILWNPALMKFRTLPLPHPYFLPHVKVYNGSQIGFGIDPLTNEYKLVLIRSFDDIINVDLYDLNVTIYNFSKNTWKLLDLGDFPLRGVSNNLNTGFLNGVYYWSYRHTIFAFDMGKEIFRKILGPDIKQPRSYINSYLVIYNEHVALLIKGQLYTDIWEMLEEGVWIKQFSITGPSLFDRPLGLWKTDDFLFTFAENRDPRNKISQMALFNVRTQEKRTLGPKGHRSYHRASVYYESLISVDCGTEQKGKHASLNTVSYFLNADHNPYSGIRRP